MDPPVGKSHNLIPLSQIEKRLYDRAKSFPSVQPEKAYILIHRLFKTILLHQALQSTPRSKETNQLLPTENSSKLLDPRDPSVSILSLERRYRSRW